MGMEIATWWVPPPRWNRPGDAGTTTPVKRRWGAAAVGEGDMGRGHYRRGGATSAWDGHAAA